MLHNSFEVLNDDGSNYDGNGEHLKNSHAEDTKKLAISRDIALELFREYDYSDAHINIVYDYCSKKDGIENIDILKMSQLLKEKFYDKNHFSNKKEGIKNIISNTPDSDGRNTVDSKNTAVCSRKTLDNSKTKHSTSQPTKTNPPSDLKKSHSLKNTDMSKSQIGSSFQKETNQKPNGVTKTIDNRSNSKQTGNSGRRGNGGVSDSVILGSSNTTHASTRAVNRPSDNDHSIHSNPDNSNTVAKSNTKSNDNANTNSNIWEKKNTFLSSVTNPSVTNPSVTNPSVTNPSVTNPTVTNPTNPTNPTVTNPTNPTNSSDTTATKPKHLHPEVVSKDVGKTIDSKPMKSVRVREPVEPRRSKEVRDSRDRDRDRDTSDSLPHSPHSIQDLSSVVESKTQKGFGMRSVGSTVGSTGMESSTKTISDKRDNTLRDKTHKHVVDVSNVKTTDSDLSCTKDRDSRSGRRSGVGDSVGDNKDNVRDGFDSVVHKNTTDTCEVDNNVSLNTRDGAGTHCVARAQLTSGMVNESVVCVKTDNDSEVACVMEALEKNLSLVTTLPQLLTLRTSFPLTSLPRTPTPSLTLTRVAALILELLLTSARVLSDITYKNRLVLSTNTPSSDGSVLGEGGEVDVSSIVDVVVGYLMAFSKLHCLTNSLDAQCLVSHLFSPTLSPHHPSDFPPTIDDLPSITSATDTIDVSCSLTNDADDADDTEVDSQLQLHLTRSLNSILNAILLFDINFNYNTHMGVENSSNNHSTSNNHSHAHSKSNRKSNRGSTLIDSGIDCASLNNGPNGAVKMTVASKSIIASTILNLNHVLHKLSLLLVFSLRLHRVGHHLGVGDGDGDGDGVTCDICGVDLVVSRLILNHQDLKGVGVGVGSEGVQDTEDDGINEGVNEGESGVGMDMGVIGASKCGVCSLKNDCSSHLDTINFIISKTDHDLDKLINHITNNNTNSNSQSQSHSSASRSFTRSCTRSNSPSPAPTPVLTPTPTPIPSSTTYTHPTPTPTHGRTTPTPTHGRISEIDEEIASLHSDLERIQLRIAALEKEKLLIAVSASAPSTSSLLFMTRDVESEEVQAKNRERQLGIVKVRAIKEEREREREVIDSHSHSHSLSSNHSQSHLKNADRSRNKSSGGKHTNNNTVGGKSITKYFRDFDFMLNKSTKLLKLKEGWLHMPVLVHDMVVTITNSRPYRSHDRRIHHHPNTQNHTLNSHSHSASVNPHTVSQHTASVHTSGEQTPSQQISSQHTSPQSVNPLSMNSNSNLNPHSNTNTTDPYSQYGYTQYGYTSPTPYNYSSYSHKHSQIPLDAFQSDHSHSHSHNVSGGGYNYSTDSPYTYPYHSFTNSLTSSLPNSLTSFNDNYLGLGQNTDSFGSSNHSLTNIQHQHQHQHQHHLTDNLSMDLFLNSHNSHNPTSNLTHNINSFSNHSNQRSHRQTSHNHHQVDHSLSYFRNQHPHPHQYPYQRPYSASERFDINGVDEKGGHNESHSSIPTSGSWNTDYNTSYTRSRPQHQHNEPTSRKSLADSFNSLDIFTTNS